MPTVAMPVPSDLEISRNTRLDPIDEVGRRAGFLDSEVITYGPTKAKISLDVTRRLRRNPAARYVDVTAITPTPLGEGKTVTTIGLSLGLSRLGKKVITTLRQPSMGPTFGIKGGAAGGGYSQVVPMEDMNLHLTGDIHAVSLAHNLLSAAVDNHLHHGNKLGIEMEEITWPRVVDLSDRVLRKIVVGLGGKLNGIIRETGFDITVASEVMAILALCSDLQDLRARLGRIVIGQKKDGKPVTAEDLKVAGAMAVLLKEALQPTLLQTTENTAALVHAGPFANIAQGNNSIIADDIALRLGDYVVTESGFGADIGFEKFCDIKCRASGLAPDCVVLVCTIRALKMHGSSYKVVAGKPLPPELVEEDLGLLRNGSRNLQKHIEIVKTFGVPCVVAVNRFATDSENELKLAQELALQYGAEAAAISDVHACGGEGGIKLAEAVEAACREDSNFQLLYPDTASFKEKIEAICTKVYGAKGVEYLGPAQKKLTLYDEWGYGSLPVCMAKTHLSLSHDPKLRNRPEGFTVTVRDVRLSAGAGFVYALLGEMSTMPGLPAAPAFERIDIDADGNIVGLS